MESTLLGFTLPWYSPEWLCQFALPPMTHEDRKVPVSPLYTLTYVPISINLALVK